ncbi:MAG: aldehyde ferredoxin oxidoreductase N-terminal domain-containing protein [Euryarchaeota archaeon]|nr:aldehyde ferredoxin oxidoreductase N-terminal domain-containing protein [Euryarchaeota archaeon]
MEIKGGYTKKILNIDLSKGKSVVTDVDDEFALKYIGGGGWGAKIVFDNLMKHPDLKPLGPENIIVIAPGPLSGLYLPASDKTSFISISPLTGIYGDSNMGGLLGVELRQAGYDALVIKGKADALSVICIDYEDIKIRSVSAYADKTSSDTERAVKEDMCDIETRVAVIGPAGENLVKFACINTEWSRNAGHTGMGAIFGSKNLKAGTCLANHKITRISTRFLC